MTSTIPERYGHHFTGGAHRWQGVTAVLRGYGGAASLLTQWVQTQVWVIDFCCTIALFLQVQPGFPLIAPLLLLSLTLNVFVPAVELPPSGPPRQLWCHLLKPEVSRRQTPERSRLARRAQIDAFWCKKKKNCPWKFCLNTRFGCLLDGFSVAFTQFIFPSSSALMSSERETTKWALKRWNGNIFVQLVSKASYTRLPLPPLGTIGRRGVIAGMPVIRTAIAAFKISH